MNSATRASVELHSRRRSNHSARADVRWIGPSGGERPKLRILAAVREEAFVASGQQYPLMAGMTGRAEIIVDRRTPIGYLFEPVRELREGLAP